jgi:hypothetical protein
MTAPARLPPDHARDVTPGAPRRGSVTYVQDEPEVAGHIIEADPTPLSAKSTLDDLLDTEREAYRMARHMQEASRRVAVGLSPDAALERALVSLRVLALRFGCTLTPVNKEEPK